MCGRQRVCLISLLVAAATIVRINSAFNIETSNPTIHHGSRSDFFGYKVLQVTSAKRSGIIVAAPLGSNGSGEICKYEREKAPHCRGSEEVPQINTTVAKYFGLTVAINPTSPELMVCSPSVAHECHGNSYLNSWCYNIGEDLQTKSTFKPGFQECTKNPVDLVFLYDGSLSMTDGEFQENKRFIMNIMSRLPNTSIKFAAVQFSDKFRTVFDFRDTMRSASEKLRLDAHMKSVTNTYKALDFVLTELFQSESAGATPDATKVLVLITDGEPSDPFKAKTVLEKYDSKSIIRFVIGVKIKDDAMMKKITPIASEPKEKNVFRIENYKGLDGILLNFQKKIFNVEGSKVTRAGNLTTEMSQSGFSAAYHKDTLVLGSVGLNSWRGALEEQHPGEAQILDPELEMDSYMGFSVSTGEKNGVPLYFSGAPRFQHTGQVVVFRNTGEKWIVQQRLREGEIGSYFGAELCSVDINSDDDTDFLLVGAPMLYQPQEKTEGKVFVYALTNEMHLNMKLGVTAPSTGRFGTSISSLADLNGDGLRDVAVGAPLEDDNRGAVYIYLGDRHSGIRSTFSQRISGRRILPGIRFFGQAIDGRSDLGDDGLPDVVVGSQGAAVVLRSKPVFNVVPHMSFHPRVISIEKINCVSNFLEILPMVNLTTCFELKEVTKSKTGQTRSKLNISYTVSVDLMRTTHRGFFNREDKKSKSLNAFSHLASQLTCFNHSVHMPACVKDTLSPISIKLNFTQTDSESANAILNTDINRVAILEIPFEKHCRQNDTCIAELEVDFNFTTTTLLVTEQNYFNISIKLDNHGDDSYNTSLTMLHSPGLSFSGMTITEATRPTLHSCYDLRDVHDRTECGISRPVYRSRSTATILSSFHVMKDVEWNDTMTMTVFGRSDNFNSSRIASVTKDVRVQYEIKMAIGVKEESVRYLNFTTEDARPKRMVTVFQIHNTGFKDFPINVTLDLPARVDKNFEMFEYQVLVQKNKTECFMRLDLKSEMCSEGSDCVVVQCHSFNLKRHSSVEFKVLGFVWLRDIYDYTKNFSPFTGGNKELKFRSLVRVSTDTRRYVLASYLHEMNSERTMSVMNDPLRDDDPTKKWNEVRVEIIIYPNRLLIIACGAGGGLLLLLIITIVLYKLGCFKRKKLQQLEEEDEFSFWKAYQVIPNPTKDSETKEEPAKTPEEQQPLQEANKSPRAEDEAD